MRTIVYETRRHFQADILLVTLCMLMFSVSVGVSFALALELPGKSQQLPGTQQLPAKQLPGSPQAPQGNQQQLQTPQQSANVLSTRPLAQHPQGQQMMSQAVQNAALMDISFYFLDKTYENDQYTTVAGQKVRTSCVRFKAKSGFKFRMDAPKFTLTTQGLTVEQNISKINHDGLAVSFQLGPCVDISAGVGIRLSNVKMVYKARPTLTFDQNNVCKLNWNLDSDDLHFSIGNVNILGVPNDIDKLTKDAVREALNFTLDGFFSSILRNELSKITVNVCGKTK